MSNLVTHDSIMSIKDMPPLVPKAIPPQKTKLVHKQKPMLKENDVVSTARPQGFNFFMLKSIEHEISTAHKN